MMEDSQTITCANCGRQLEEDSSETDENRPLCPDCGSTAQVIHVRVHDGATFHERLGLKGRHLGEKKPFIEQVRGADLQRKTGNIMHKSRIIDRENDLYHEKITDPRTGEVVHECKEPLSRHRGHGSDKKVD
jgi:DNA-directed RNA polymerase subunit RPC12/RpoP